MSRVAVQMEVEDGKNTTVADLVASLFQEEEIGLPSSCAPVFALWMCSGLLGKMAANLNENYLSQQQLRVISCGEYR